MNLVTVPRVLRRRAQLASHDDWTRDQLDSWQRQRLAELRRFAMARSSLYRSLHARLEDAPLESLPVISKSLLMERFDELVTDARVKRTEVERHVAEHCEGRFLGEYVVTSTAGTSGFKGIFLANASEWLDVLASYARASQWAGTTAGLFHRTRIAVVSSRNPSHQSAAVGMTVQSPWVPTLRLDATQPISEIVEALNAFRPDSLIAYASMATLLADEQLEGRLRISPRTVQCSS